MSTDQTSSGATYSSEWDRMAGYMDKVSRTVALPPTTAMMLEMNAKLPFNDATGILDTGCGGGICTSRLIEIYGPNLPKPAPRMLACDFSKGMVDRVEELAKEKAASGSPIWANVETAVRDAQDLQGLEDGSFSHAVAGLVFFMVPDPQKALTETRRVLKDGGVLGLSSWKSSAWKDLMALGVGQENAAPLEKVLPQAWRSTEGVTEEMTKAGFSDVTALEVNTQLEYDSHEDFCHFLLTVLPHMKRITDTWTPERLDAAKSRMIAEMKQMSPVAPGAISGTAIVAIGRK